MRRYIDLKHEPNGNLTLVLTEAGRAELDECCANAERMPELYDLLEYNRCNGELEFLQPEDIGALTSSDIISTDAEFDDQGNFISATEVYWYPQYELYDPVAELREHGSITFTRAGARK